MKKTVKMRRTEILTFNSNISKTVAASKIKEHFSAIENVIDYKIVGTWVEGEKVNFKFSVDLS